jgi:RimJ/RimL family protein N-acetyltransferase
MAPGTPSVTFTDRLAVPSDAAFIVALHAAPHARPFVHVPTEIQVRTSIAGGDAEQRIVLEGDTPVGMWRLRLQEDWLAEFIRIVAIAPRRGIGTFAMNRMIARAFDDLGAHRAYLEVVAHNPARSLYERAGFRLEGTWRDGYRNEDGTYADLCAYGMLAGDRR